MLKSADVLNTRKKMHASVDFKHYNLSIRAVDCNTQNMVNSHTSPL